jgi:acyl carrier protein
MGLDLVELVLEVEEAFAIEIPDREAQKLTTPRLLQAFIISELKKKNQAFAEDQVKDRLYAIIKRTLGIKQFNEDDRFVDDLGVD